MLILVSDRLHAHEIYRVREACDVVDAELLVLFDVALAQHLALLLLRRPVTLEDGLVKLLGHVEVADTGVLLALDLLVQPRQFLLLSLLFHFLMPLLLLVPLLSLLPQQIKILSEHRLRVFERLFDFVLYLVVLCSHDPLRREHIVPVPQVVEHDAHGGRTDHVALLTVTLKEPDDLYIAVNYREETVLVHVVVTWVVNVLGIRHAGHVVPLSLELDLDVGVRALQAHKLLLHVPEAFYIYSFVEVPP